MSTEDVILPIEGRCSCGEVHFHMMRMPMFVHCCHCSWCQRESGSAFAVNAMLESSELSIVKGQVEDVKIETLSGGGQTVARCPNCKIALWSYYGAAREKVAFIRVGTLLSPQICPPDIHIFTSTKQPWLTLNDAKPQMEAFYRRSEVWPEESVLRYKAAVK